MCVKKMLPMALVSKGLDVNLYLKESIVKSVKLDTIELGTYVNHVIVILMEDEVFAVITMGNAIVKLDTLATNVIPVYQDSMTQMEMTQMKMCIVLNAFVTLVVP